MYIFSVRNYISADFILKIQNFLMLFDVKVCNF